MAKLSRKELTYPEVIITDMKAYYFYRQEVDKIPSSYRIRTYREWKKIVKAIWKETSVSLLESTGGVNINGFGYFVNWMCPLKKVVRRFNGEKIVNRGFNDHTEHHSFHPMFLPQVVYGNPFAEWTMDYKFTDDFKRALYKKLISGQKYKNLMNEVRYLNRSRSVK